MEKFFFFRLTEHFIFILFTTTKLTSHCVSKDLILQHVKPRGTEQGKKARGLVMCWKGETRTLPLYQKVSIEVWCWPSSHAMGEGRDQRSGDVMAFGGGWEGRRWVLNRPKRLVCSSQGKKKIWPFWSESMSKLSPLSQLSAHTLPRCLERGKGRKGKGDGVDQTHHHVSCESQERGRRSRGEVGRRARESTLLELLSLLVTH